MEAESTHLVRLVDSDLSLSDRTSKYTRPRQFCNETLNRRGTRGELKRLWRYLRPQQLGLESLRKIAQSPDKSRLLVSYHKNPKPLGLGVRQNADLSKWSEEGHTMRFIQPGLSILAVVMLLISLYRFVEGFQNWQEARQIKQRSLDE